MAQKSASPRLPNFKSSTKSSTVDPKKAAVLDDKPEAKIGHVQTPRVKSQKQGPLPALPKAKQPSFSSHRNDANAALALDLLADVEGTIKGWHQALRQILLDIQDLYRAGPIIEGWLESIPAEGQSATLPAATNILRHGDVQQVAAYVDKISHPASLHAAGSGTQYRLCSLDADGQMQCQICPPEQLGAVSQGIARHQQLRQLLHQKQHLEARLKSAADALEITRQTLGITGSSAESNG